MKKIIYVLFFVFALFEANVSLAKNDAPKFGKVSPEEINATVCPIDSNAHAYYLFDRGNSYFSYSEALGFVIYYERHFRIKIVDKSGLDYATIAIPYYDNGSSRENMGNIKACSYNMEGGKVVKTMLEKSAIFEEKTSKYMRQKKFALPNVKEGTVIEVTYSKSSKLLGSLPSWQFQYFIPVMESEYEVLIPEYFKYNQFHRGAVRVKTDITSESSTIPQDNGQSIRYQTNGYVYKIDSVPAFPIGEELTTPDNYICKVDYELSSYKFPNSLLKSFSSTWEDVDKSLMDDGDFGERLKSTGFLKDDAALITAKTNDNVAKMNEAFRLVKSKMKWNEYSSCWSSDPLKKTYETGTGNSADINLNLVGLLKQLDLDAYPVVLSTRSNGMIHPVSPSINQMNYTIALCKIGGINYLLDATDKYSEPNVLPVRCLNGEGRIVDYKNLGWVPLLNGKKSKTLALYSISLNNEGKFSGKIDFVDYEFAAMRKRNVVKDYESEEKYIEKLQENNAGLLVKNFQFTNLDTTGVELKYQYDVEISDKVDVAGDLLYFVPLLFDAREKNPFSLAEREYPIEYAYPYTEIVIANIEIPSGYKVESLPKPVKVSAYDNNFQLAYNTAQEGNKLVVKSTISVNQTLIPAMNYQEIKSFFEKVVEKHLEKVVLKKM